MLIDYLGDVSTSFEGHSCLQDSPAIQISLFAITLLIGFDPRSCGCQVELPKSRSSRSGVELDTSVKKKDSISRHRSGVTILAVVFVTHRVLLDVLLNSQSNAYQV
jgi:hypothetical protein